MCDRIFLTSCYGTTYKYTNTYIYVNDTQKLPTKMSTDRRVARCPSNWMRAHILTRTRVTYHICQFFQMLYLTLLLSPWITYSNSLLQFVYFACLPVFFSSRLGDLASHVLCLNPSRYLISVGVRVCVCVCVIVFCGLMRAWLLVYFAHFF